MKVILRSNNLCEANNYWCRPITYDKIIANKFYMARRHHNRENLLAVYDETGKDFTFEKFQFWTAEEYAERMIKGLPV